MTAITAPEDCTRRTGLMFTKLSGYIGRIQDNRIRRCEVPAEFDFAKTKLGRSLALG